MNKNKSQTFERNSLFLFSLMAVVIGATLTVLTLMGIGSGDRFWTSFILSISVALFGVIQIYKIKKKESSG